MHEWQPGMKGYVRDVNIVGRILMLPRQGQWGVGEKESVRGVVVSE